MATFITRVELHGADYQDYETLHSKMRGEGYTNNIVGSDGVQYWLPPAEYRLEDDCTIDTARTRAKRAANATGRNSAVLVSQYTSAAWNGLERVEVKKYG